ncbi:ATP-binding protein [Alicyclobacillus sp. SO9]|uniref:HAMP domain-containing sensor histidine kinase n=1 Tax=Alicyclobacillus sp. SO9 TaxID=2665646 RepID=UPI0018E7CB3A|nr:ATP-binding protein [Alicyclobacillus sp. SO9]QQE77816.1 HAMP domain-containing protein [Alicyclobacillus sp. SO9]
MKLRDKFLIALASLVLLMAAVFFALSEGYTAHLFKSYATTAAKQESVNQWVQFLRYYYYSNGNSWNNLGFLLKNSRTLHEALRNESLTLTDTQNHVIVQTSVPNVRGKSVQVTEPITSVSGKQVATLTVRDWSKRNQNLFQIEQGLLHSMTTATVLGLFATALVAVLLGAWLASRITRPLKDMTKAMHKIEEGDLETRLSLDTKDEFGQVASAFNQMIDRLYETEQARRHLVADVAHELRTPLTIMQGKLELIQQGVEPAEPSTLLPIQDEVFRLTSLVQDLHRLSLAEVGQLPLHKVPTNIAQLVERVVENFQVEADDHDIQLRYESMDDTNIDLRIDPNRITQVFVNLLGNAMRYTPGEGTVTVSMNATAESIAVAVADTGNGIDEEHLSHIFDRFYRAQADRSRETGGTGLGLAIAKEFVEAHNGTIEVESKVGKGTTFTVSLPRENSPATS